MILSRLGSVAVVMLSVVTFVEAEGPTVSMDAIQRVIRESEYHVTWQDQTVLPDLKGAWHATNRAQNLRFYFTEDGLWVVDRTNGAGPELLRLGPVLPLDGGKRPATFEATGNELSVRSRGLTESFVNTPRGLEHTITVSGPPSETGLLAVPLRWSAAGLDVDSGVATFRSSTGLRLTYSVIEALDANRARVRALVDLHGDQLAITVADSGVVYPVTVKNLLTGVANTILEGNSADLWMAAGVAVGDLNGDGYADVATSVPGWDGGQTDEGAVLIFNGGPGGIESNGTGPIAASADGVIESNVSNLNWPYSVAVVGDLDGDGFDDLVAGDTGWDPVNPPLTSQLWGAAWVFMGSMAGITATTMADADTFIASDRPWAEFGHLVHDAGDVNGDGYADLIVSGIWWSDDAGQPDEGCVFVFHGSASGITATSSGEAETLLEGNGAHLGTIGKGVGDLNGDGFDDVAAELTSLSHPETSEGGIAVFYGGAAGIAGNATQPMADAADALIEGNEALLGLGEVGRAGDVNGDGFGDLIIGAWYWGDSPAHQYEGAVAIFHGGPSGVVSNPSGSFVDAADTFIEGNPNPHHSLHLGTKVMPVGDCNGDGYGDVATGTFWYENGQIDEGAVFVFFGGDGGIPDSRTDPVEAVADVVIEGNLVGAMVANSLHGDVNGDGLSDLVIPAPHISSPENNEGAVLIYHGGADALAQEADAHHDFSVADASFGTRVRDAGDLNGDGFADFAVGAPFHDVVSNSEGSVHVFYGSTDPSLSSPDWSFFGQDLRGWTGVGVASAGDLNGDGFGDLVVGTPHASNPEIDEGRVDVFYGSAAGLSSSPDWSYESNLDDVLAGRAVSTAGDINGDGYGDLIIGAPLYSNGQSSEGRACVFFGSSLGLPPNPGWTYESDVASAELGFSVASAGDVNGDGFGDVIIGAYGYTSGESYEGAAYGFYGSENGLPDVPNWFIQTNRVIAFYGLSVAGAGDVNSDGFSDVIVGAPYDTNGETEEGRAYVYHGSTAGLSTVANQVLEENIADAGFGVGVAAAGDVNGDGFSDVTVGSPYVGVPGSFDGRAYIYLGTATGVASDPAWLIEATGANDLLGDSAAGVGDVNGDGFSDVVVGVPGSDSGSADGGSVELYFGNAGAGRPVLARQYRGGDDPRPVQPWGLSHSGDAFEVSVTATSPRGRELVKIHVEACPPGEVWGDVDCRHAVSADWTEIPLGENGVVLTEAVSGLTEDVLYHWRAHVLYLPLHADEPGIIEPPVPRHGPWRRLSARATGADIRVGAPQTITIELVGASSAVDEGAPLAEIGLVMTTSDGEVSGVDSSVEFDTFDMTAVAGEDYVHTSFNRFFPAGTASGTAQIIEVGLINDDLDEPDEDFVVELYGPFGALLGPQTVHTVTIVDDDPPPELSAANVEVLEGAGVATVVLELSAPTSFEVTVDFATVEDTATSPEDFVHVSETAMIPPLDTTTTVDIPIEDDWSEEPEETFVLALTGATNAVLVTPSVTITIVDDDAGFLFGDGFESGDTTAWGDEVP